MIKRLLQFLGLICTSAISLFVLNSCNKNSEPSFEEKLEWYLAKEDVYVEHAQSTALYFDMSAPLVAIRNDANIESTFLGILNQLNNVLVYDLGADTIVKSDKPAKELYEYYQHKGKSSSTAPIEKTLNKIVEEGVPALLVTDFEEYKEGTIYTSGYAAEPFEKWIIMGGDITFFITPFKEDGKDKKLFYVVFDYPDGHLLDDVKKGLDGKPQNYQTFTLSTNFYKFETNYPSASVGGNYHDGDGYDVVSSVPDDGFMKLDKYCAESYIFENSWEDIVVNAAEQTKSNGAAVPFTHLFRNLFIDLSNEDSYTIKKISLTIQDIQQDFDKYSCYFLAKNNPPKITKDDGGIVVEFAEDSDVKEYYDENGNLKKEYDYPQLNRKNMISEVSDLLEIDNQLFQDSYKKNSNKVEIGIKFKKGTNGVIMNENSKDNHLYRVDLFIDEIERANLNKIESLFSWGKNNCMSESIKVALDKAMPKGKLLYSYFIRIQ